MRTHSDVRIGNIIFCRSVVQEVTEPSSPVVSEPVEAEPVEENKIASAVDTDFKTNQSSTTPETRRVDENKEDKSMNQQRDT